MRSFPKVSLRHAAVILAGTGGLAAGMILAVPGIASAQAVTCGETINTDTTLTANLNCTGYTSGPALTIGAADVTLSLGGHKILGPGDSYQTDGVSDSGYSDVTVEDGSLSNFYVDVYFDGANGADLTGIVVQHVSTTDKTQGSSISVEGAYLDGASVTRVAGADALVGVLLEDSEDSTVSGNKLTSPYYGFIDEDGTADTWSGNTVTNGQYEGFDIEGATDDVIQGNTVDGTRNTDGVVDDNSTASTVTGNTLSDVYDGVGDFGGSDGTISGNTGTGDVYGIYSGGETDYTISGNTFTHGEYGIETDTPTGEVLTGNTVNDNGEAGVYVWTNDASGYSATLTSNTGNDNRFGLYSQITTTGSENHASGNKVVNCYNVKCVKAKGGRSLAVAPPHYAPRYRAAPARWGRQ